MWQTRESQIGGTKNGNIDDSREWWFVMKSVESRAHRQISPCRTFVCPQRSSGSPGRKPYGIRHSGGSAEVVVFLDGFVDVPGAFEVFGEDDQVARPEIDRIFAVADGDFAFD